MWETDDSSEKFHAALRSPNTQMLILEYIHDNTPTNDDMPDISVENWLFHF